MSVGNATVRTEGPFFRWLDGVWGRRALRAPDGYPCEFTLGWLGYLGYELKRETGGSNVTAADPRRLPDLRRPRRGPGPSGAHGVAAGPGHRGRRGLARGGPLGRHGSGEPGGRRRQHGVGYSPPAPGLPDRFRARDTEAGYKAKIAESQREILEGNTYEVCLTTARLTAPTPPAADGLDPWQAYLALRRKNPAPFASYLRFGDLAVASTSPERFLRIAADGGMRAEPIKGTRRRDADPGRDAAAAARPGVLAQGPGREHHDRRPAAQRPQPLCRAGLGLGQQAVRHRKLRHRAPDGEHHRCAAQARHAAGRGRRGLLPRRFHDRRARRSAPWPSWTGSKRRRAGVYSGAIGYFSLNGARTSPWRSGPSWSAPAAPTGDGSTVLSLGVGGAITADSSPQEEYEEIRTKAFGVLSALGAEFPPG